MSNEIKVNGKSVVLRERFPLEEFFGLPGLVDAVDYKDLRTAIPLFIVAIESWEFDGDPTDPAAYMGMDVRSEVMPLAMKVASHISEYLREHDPKN